MRRGGGQREGGRGVAARTLVVCWEDRGKLGGDGSNNSIVKGHSLGRQSQPGLKLQLAAEQRSASACPVLCWSSRAARSLPHLDLVVDDALIQGAHEVCWQVLAIVDAAVVLQEALAAHLILDLRGGQARRVGWSRGQHGEAGGHCRRCTGALRNTVSTWTPLASAVCVVWMHTMHLTSSR